MTLLTTNEMRPLLQMFCSCVVPFAQETKGSAPHFSDKLEQRRTQFSLSLMKECKQKVQNIVLLAASQVRPQYHANCTQYNRTPRSYRYTPSQATKIVVVVGFSKDLFLS